MRLPFGCMKCFKEGGSPFDLSWREFTDSGVYEVTCRNGHDTTFILQEQKFEILFDIGAYAIQDGYYREAISSFTSSLERFYEFSIQVLLFKKDFNYEAFCDTWKLVSNQSERQLGAFVFLYFQRFNQKPQLLSDSNVKLRNQVVHKGKIPTKSEAISYGQSVLDVVRPLLAILKRDFSDAIIEVVFNHIIESRDKVKGDHHYSGINISTIISLTNGEPSHDSKTLEEAIASLVPYFRGEL